VLLLASHASGSNGVGMVSGCHGGVRKTVKGKSVFPTEIALFKALYLAVTEASKRWTVRTRNWPEIMAQLSVFFQDRLKDSFR